MIPNLSLSVPCDLQEEVKKYEASLIILALKMNKGNKSAAARDLRLHRPTLSAKIKILGINELALNAD